MEEADSGGEDGGNYEITIETNLKEYYVKEESYDGVFGPGKIIAQNEGTTGINDRFYLMALEDINAGTYYCWYDAADGKLNKVVSVAENDFGQGRTNTEYVMEKWNDESLPWGKHNTGVSPDMWGVIQEKVEKGWFVPSKSEWVAFGEALSIDEKNYASYSLSKYYWSSSHYSTFAAYTIVFDFNGDISHSTVSGGNYVRLSTTF